ncbi:MAG: ROK family protein [Chitinophagaceae bacterium]
MPVLTIDLGGTSIKLGIVKNGSLIDASHIPSDAKEKLEVNLERASEGLQNLLCIHHIHVNEVEGIGISFPGIVDRVQNRVISRYVKYNDATGFDFSAWAQQRWQLPMVLENDARAALIGEWQYGAGRGYDNIAMITLGTGLGSAVLINGKLLRGQNFIAGNLWGHISINLNGRTCNCGYLGCLETEASTWVLNEKFKSYAGYEHSSLFTKDILFAGVFNEAAKGDEIAKEMMNHCLHAWGICAVNMVHAYDPQVLIFSGGVMEQASIILPHIQTMIDKYAWLPPGTVNVVKSEQVTYASLLGLKYLITKKNEI